jgi:murein L,D-transpeptidase YafK
MFHLSKKTHKHFIEATRNILASINFWEGWKKHDNSNSRSLSRYERKVNAIRKQKAKKIENVKKKKKKCNSPTTWIPSWYQPNRSSMQEAQIEQAKAKKIDKNTLALLQVQRHNVVKRLTGTSRLKVSS